MDRLEKSGTLVQDANEGKWIVDSLQRIANRDAPQEVKTRAEELIKAINQRLMSQYPLGTRVPMSEEQIWQDLEDAGYMRTPQHERGDQKAEEQKTEEPKGHDDDEMAATAGRLLERVADNTSEKFQNSQFLGLMRRLRDREVRVQEDKIVEVEQPAVSQPQSEPKNYVDDYQAQLLRLEQQNKARLRQGQEYQRLTQARAEASGPISSQIPDVDPTILNHAATDFGMPVYEEEGREQYAQSTSPITGEQLLTDEISDQYRYYNVKGAYHR
jgi:hypothetical protein